MLQSWEGDRYLAEKEMYSVVAAIQTYKKAPLNLACLEQKQVIHACSHVHRPFKGLGYMMCRLKPDSPLSTNTPVASPADAKSIVHK